MRRLLVVTSMILVAAVMPLGALAQETSLRGWPDVRPMTTDRIKNRMASGDQNPRGKPDWHSVQQLRFDPIEARKTPTAWNFAPWADHRTYMDVSLALVLPQSWATSDAEAKRITEFLNSADGPRTVLANGQAGLFDEHGRLRTTGALDAMIAPSSAASAVVLRSDKPVPRDNVSFEAIPAAYANAEAGGGREQTSGWVDKIRDEWLNHIPPTIPG